MQVLSQDEIAELIERVGSDTQIALAANCETTAVPRDWARGKATPTDAQMERLRFLKEAMDIVTRKHGGRAAKTWVCQANCYGGTMTPISAIRNGQFDEALVSAQRATNRY